MKKTKTCRKIEVIAKNLGLDLDVFMVKEKYRPREYRCFRRGQQWAMFLSLAEAADLLVNLSIYAE